MDELLCCPIPLSLPAALARQSCSEDAGPMTDVLGVLTLGLSSDTATSTRCDQTCHYTSLWLRLAQRANYALAHSCMHYPERYEHFSRHYRLKEVLQELAVALAETIEHDSTDMVEQVCKYHLGVSRTELPVVPLQEPSASCSDEVPCLFFSR